MIERQTVKMSFEDLSRDVGRRLNDKAGKPSDTYASPVAPPAVSPILQTPGNYIAPRSEQKPAGMNPQAALAFAAANKRLQDLAEVLAEIRRNNPPREKTVPTDMSDRQMKALGRNHLLMMLRDTQAELDQLRGEYEKLLTGLHAGIALQTGGAL